MLDKHILNSLRELRDELRATQGTQVQWKGKTYHEYNVQEVQKQTKSSRKNLHQKIQSKLNSELNKK